MVGCLLSSARLVVDTPRLGEGKSNTALREGARFVALRNFLPKRGVIGYVGQKENGVEEYYLAQYALAPLVVEHSLNHSIVVGNFPTSKPPDFPSNLERVKDFGDGVLLFANKDAR